MTATTAFDGAPLVEPFDRKRADAWIDAMGRRGSLLPGSRYGAHLTQLIGFTFFALVFVAIGFGIPAALRADSGDSMPVLLWLAPLIVIVVGFTVSLVVIRIVRRRDRDRVARLGAFAHANGMTYRERLGGPRPGMLLQAGRVDRAEILSRRSDDGRLFEVGNLTLRTPRGSGVRRIPPRWGMVAVRLDARLPHIILDARGNNSILGRTNLPDQIHTDQRLRLEGDFDRYFALYCPAGYERDALYLFTPDIMAMMIDRFAQLDVEVVDDWLLFYSRHDLATLDPAVWEWLFAVSTALEAKLGQWERWRDGRAPQPSAGGDPVPPGQVRPPALRTRPLWGRWAVVGGGAALIVWIIVSGVIEIVGSVRG